MLPGHHRPYEGQQPDYLYAQALLKPPVIIAPTRGSNLLTGHPAAAAGAEVIIAPTRGSNLMAHAHWILPCCHHRPYEGQQQRGLVSCRQAAGVIIAPTRGSNTSDALMLAWSLVPSSSPLRGAATAPSGCARPVSSLVIIAPTRGSNSSGWSARLNAALVIIAPTRGSNRFVGPTMNREIIWVIIAPTRGSNLDGNPGAAMQLWGHHRPYEGQQQFLSVRLPAFPWSSSPLRGAATRVAGADAR